MKKENIAIIAGILGSIVLLAAIIVVYYTRDKDGPMISVGSTNVTYTEGQDKNVLLEGVSAYDKKDGDVTDSLIVESVIVVSDGKKAKIVYAAKDSSNNITKSSKIVNYIKNSGSSSVDKPTQENTGSSSMTVSKATESTGTSTEKKSTSVNPSSGWITPTKTNPTTVKNTSKPETDPAETESASRHTEEPSSEPITEPVTEPVTEPSSEEQPSETPSEEPSSEEQPSEEPSSEEQPSETPSEEPSSEDQPSEAASDEGQQQTEAEAGGNDPAQE